MTYKLIDQTGEGFSPKEKQWLISATGQNCECECGGKNHGGSH